MHLLLMEAVSHGDVGDYELLAIKKALKTCRPWLEGA
jgi:hypothetical protein